MRFTTVALTIVLLIAVASAQQCGNNTCKRQEDCYDFGTCSQCTNGTCVAPKVQCNSFCTFSSQCTLDSGCNSCVWTSNDDQCCQCLPRNPGECGGKCGRQPDGRRIECTTGSCPMCSYGTCSPDTPMDGDEGKQQRFLQRKKELFLLAKNELH